MNLLSRIGESGAVLRPRTSSKARELPVDQILMGDCIAEMAKLPDKSVDMAKATWRTSNLRIRSVKLRIGRSFLPAANNVRSPPLLSQTVKRLPSKFC